ncbi:hypothetical protein [Bifidobacterium aquikefiri]|uniref:hypothetical protein n=1 Tax=Bifidobacterium aquikefiri TaxID=1653207 RepID=UPI0023F373F1|nr:hypothetical protein [Bifidobacterium aquikefiri]
MTPLFLFFDCTGGETGLPVSLQKHDLWNARHTGVSIMDLRGFAGCENPGLPALRHSNRSK